MAGSYCKITIIGNLGRDPEMRYLPSGEAVTSFSVAVSERFKTRDGQQQERTMWFNVSAFQRLADVANQYLHKGSSVYIEGSLQQREYTDRDGVARTSLDVRARELKMLDKRGEGGEFGEGGGDFSAPRSNAAPSAADDTNMDEIPF